MTSQRMRWSWCRVGFSSCCCCCWRCFYILIFRKTHTTNLCDAACRLALALLDLHWRWQWRRRRWWWLQSRGCVFFILFVSRVGGCCWWSTNEGTWEKSFSNKMWNTKNTDCDVVKKQPSLTHFPLPPHSSSTTINNSTNCVIILFAKK